MDNEKQKSIIAIDDNVTQLKIFEQFLKTKYELTLVKSASEATKVLGTREFDLILLDIEMPDVSGFEFLHEIRKIPKCMFKPVIIITSHSEPELLAHAKNSSAAGVLVKPVKIEELSKAIEEAFAKPKTLPFDL